MPACRALIGMLAGAGLQFAQQYTISTVAGGAPPSTPVAGAAISIGQPQRITTDASGNLFFTSLNCVFRLDGKGVLTLVAGNSRAGFGGDGGPATRAQLNAPRGLAVDSSGDVFIADTGNNVVREVTAAGQIQTVAGTGTPGFSGDGGPATQALLQAPTGVAVDGSGNLYIADSGNHLVREVTTDGNINTFAGNQSAAFSGDNGAATAAGLHDPQDVALGSNGTVYIVDTGNAAIRAVTSGTITTVAGDAAVGYAGDGGVATKATMYGPLAMAVDSSGNLYVSEFGNNVIRMVNAKGTISTVVGTGKAGFAGDGSTATKANLNLPSGVAVDSQGNIYIADTWNSRIRKVTSGNINTVAGNGVVSYSGDGGLATAAQLNGPRGVAADAAGNLYIADSRNAVVRKASKDGAISTISGNALVYPQGVAVDAAGNAYVADYQDNRVRKISPQGNVTTYAGNGSAGDSGDGGAAANAQLNAPFGVALDPAGNLYIAEFSGNRIRKVATDGSITTVAGNGIAGYSGDGGAAIQASLDGPFSVAVDTAGNVYIADTANYRIREVTTDGSINTIAGTGLPGYSGDGGPASQAQIVGPTGIAIDSVGDLYFVDGNARIRKIFPSGNIITIAGTGTPGYAGDGGLALQAQLNGPASLALDAVGNVFVADAGNNAIRLLQPTGSGITLKALTSAATNLAGPVAPGEIVVLYGSGMGPDQLQTYSVGPNGLVGRTLAGTSVFFGGTAATVLYTSSTQVAVVVPYEIVGSSVQVFVQYNQGTSAPMTLPVAQASPGLFTVDSSGRGQAVAVNQDLQTNRVGNPASLGSSLTFFATGTGATSPFGTDGLPASPPLPLITLPVTVTIGGQAAQVTYSGGAPGQVAGISQITVQVPATIDPGNAVPLTLQVGDVTAPAGVTVAISK